MSKPTLAILSTTGCTGCVISFLDLHEEILEILEKVDLVYCTTIMDVKEIPARDIGIVNGTIGNEHDVELVKDLREKAKMVIALGSCACFGGLPGLRNYYTREETLEYAYIDTVTSEDKIIPSEVVSPLLEQVDIVENIINVDYKIPGCPPLPSMIKSFLISILEGKEPEHPTRNLCAECNKKHEKMLIPTKEFLTFNVYAPHEIEYDNNLCFLEQGILCIGFATREGCQGRCVEANIPCRGCMGPLEKEMDQGCAAISGLASIFPIGQLIKQEDLPGSVYRYSLPHSYFHRIYKAQKGDKQK